MLDAYIYDGLRAPIGRRYYQLVLDDGSLRTVYPEMAAELRLLPLLTTHLSFREIAERLYVSRNTVKSQAISVYRKLDASSRSEAIERAVALGLVDAPASSVPSFTPRG